MRDGRVLAEQIGHAQGRRWCGGRCSSLGGDGCCAAFIERFHCSFSIRTCLAWDTPLRLEDRDTKAPSFAKACGTSFEVAWKS
jgi:hypothetical protein